MAYRLHSEPRYGVFSYTHSGDFGDIVASLASIRQLGGGRYFITPHSGIGVPREQMTRERAEWLLPLLRSQPYILGAEYSDRQPADVSHDFASFRAVTPMVGSESLAHWHARHIGISELDISPWLEAEPNPQYFGKVVIARSPRYHNPTFPWNTYLQQYRGRLAFVGLASEHAAMQKLTRWPIPHAPTPTALEMARIIAACQLFIGNQSLPCWIAMALGVPVIQETFAAVPNSIIRRYNSQFISQVNGSRGRRRMIPA